MDKSQLNPSPESAPNHLEERKATLQQNIENLLMGYDPIDTINKICDENNGNISFYEDDDCWGCFIFSYNKWAEEIKLASLFTSDSIPHLVTDMAFLEPENTSLQEKVELYEHLYEILLKLHPERTSSGVERKTSKWLVTTLWS